jgi:hypothetical protein
VLMNRRAVAHSFGEISAALQKLCGRARLRKLSRAGRLGRADKLLVRRTRFLFRIRSSCRADDFMVSVVSGWVASGRRDASHQCSNGTKP